MSIRQEDILKHILLQEFERMQPDISTFEDDPMQFILRKYPGLNETLTYLMTDSFKDYLTGVYIVAPKPTTFKVVLHNGQFFFLQFTGKTYQATVAGKNYYLMSIGEKERCMLAIARLLRFGSPLKTKGPEGAEQGTRDAEGGESAGGETGGGEEAAPETGGEEEPIAEAKILEEVLKKTLNEKDTITKFSTKYETEALNDLNNQIESIKKELGKSSIKIKIKEGLVYDSIKGAVNQPGTQPKSDFNLVDLEGNPKIFISHKKSGGVKAFPRWGSFQYLYNRGEKEVMNFIQNIHSFISKNESSGNKLSYASIDENSNEIVFSNGAAFAQKISNDNLKAKLVFGEEYGSENFGINNIQLVIQGKVSLKNIKDDLYEFDKSQADKIFINGDIPSGEYEPVLHAQYRGSYNELGIKNGETMARPIGAIPQSEIIWEPNEILDSIDKYAPKGIVSIPKEESKVLRYPGGEKEIFVTTTWYNNFIKKEMNKKKINFFDTKFPSPKGYVRIKPNFRKEFFISTN